MSSFMRIYPILILVLVFFGCKEDVAEPNMIGEEYYPLELGSFIVYDVDSIVHDNALGIHDLHEYQIKEVVHSTFEDNEGNEMYRIERFWRPDSSASWQLKDIWSRGIYDNRAYKIEEDVRYVRLVFPFREALEWDGNAENIHEEWEHSLDYYEMPTEIGAMNFSNTAFVKEVDNVNLIRAEIGESIYAKNVGLVYKRLDTLDFDTIVPIGTMWEPEDVKLGIEYEMIYVEHGVE